MKRILLSICVAVLAGCPLDFNIPDWKMVCLTFHIGIGGHGTLRMDILDITPSKEGEEGEKQIENFIESFGVDAADLPEGCANVKQGIGYDSDGKLNAFMGAILRISSVYSRALTAVGRTA